MTKKRSPEGKFCVYVCVRVYVYVCVKIWSALWVIYHRTTEMTQLLTHLYASRHVHTSTRPKKERMYTKVFECVYIYIQTTIIHIYIKIRVAICRAQTHPPRHGCNTLVCVEKAKYSAKIRPRLLMYMYMYVSAHVCNSVVFIHFCGRVCVRSAHVYVLYTKRNKRQITAHRSRSRTNARRDT